MCEFPYGFPHGPGSELTELPLSTITDLGLTPCLANREHNFISNGNVCLYTWERNFALMEVAFYVNGRAILNKWEPRCV